MRHSLFAASLGALVLTGVPPALAATSMSEASLRVAATDPAANGFYDRAGWQAAWDARDEKALRAAVREARRHGIDSQPYLRKLDAVSSPAARDAALTEVALAYARALAYGVVNPENLFDLYTLDRSATDLAGGLAAALEKNRVGAWLESLAPDDAEYLALSKAYVEAADAGLSDRARQLAVNLERRRWLSRHPGQRRIDVNTAATFLEYWRDGQVVRRARVVAGKPQTPTPQLGSTMTRLVVNPPWNVPTRIARNEILPKGRGYLRRHNMYVENGRVIQRPGPGSALGVVKFDLDNPYAIYLHDTPSKSFFKEDERHRSHGCVRVQDAADFARLLAQEEGKGAEFDEALASGKTSSVNLQNLPVRLLYHTAYLDPSGKVAYAPDEYGLDKTVARAMGMDGGDQIAATAAL